MINDKMIKYVTEGVTQLTRKDYLYVVLGGWCVVLGSAVWGFYWEDNTTPIIMIAIALIASISMLILSCGKIALLKKHLVLQTIHIIFWLLELNLMMTMVFIQTFGANLCLLLLYVPNILQPIFVCLRKTRDFRRKGYIHPIRIILRLIAPPMCSAFVIWLVYSLLDMPTERILIPVFLACFHFVSVAISSGLQTFQQLYYLNRFEQDGIL